MTEASITCPRCQRVSYHPTDIARRYCGACHMFHDDMPVLPACAWCGEPIAAGETHKRGPENLHSPCLIRMVVGGLNHQRGRCSCCHPGSGFEPPDPPGLSKRDAASAAADEFFRSYKKQMGEVR